MAKAIVTGIEQSYLDTGTTPKLQVGVIYGGVDVTGNFQKKAVMVDISGVTDIAGLATAVAAAVRAAATAAGYTVGAGNVFLPDYVTA